MRKPGAFDMGGIAGKIDLDPLVDATFLPASSALPAEMLPSRWLLLESSLHNRGNSVSGRFFLKGTSFRNFSNRKVIFQLCKKKQPDSFWNQVAVSGRRGSNPRQPPWQGAYSDYHLCQPVSIILYNPLKIKDLTLICVSHGQIMTRRFCMVAILIGYHFGRIWLPRPHSADRYRHHPVKIHPGARKQLDMASTDSDQSGD